MVASPAYLADKKLPAVPSHLTAHRCSNLHLPTQGGLYAWDLEKDGQALRVRVTGWSSRRCGTRRSEERRVGKECPV